MMYTIITNTCTIARFLLTHSHRFKNRKAVARHKLFFKIHDLFICLVGLFGCALILCAMDTIELSTATGVEFWITAFRMVGVAGIGFGILALLANFNDASAKQPMRSFFFLTTNPIHLPKSFFSSYKSLYQSWFRLKTHLAIQTNNPYLNPVQIRIGVRVVPYLAFRSICHSGLSIRFSNLRFVPIMAQSSSDLQDFYNKTTNKNFFPLFVKQIIFIRMWSTPFSTTRIFTVSIPFRQWNTRKKYM